MKIIGNDWDELLAEEWGKPYYQELQEFLRYEYSDDIIYPPEEDIFNALRMTPFADVKVVILGQDPYHEPGQAQGLAFSVPEDVQAPPSLVNILKELRSDLGATGGGLAYARAAGLGSAMGRTAAGSAGGAAAAYGAAAGDSEAEMSGILVPWTAQGVLLLNTVLTVRAHDAGSHRGHGWETFTDRVIELLAEREKPAVFILWGANARSKADLIMRAQQRTAAGRRHLIIQAPHPSPLSAHRGFFGGRYFSRANYFLVDNGIEPVDWRLPAAGIR